MAKHIYTQLEIDYVQKYFANHPTKHIALCLDIPESNVNYIAYKHELKKSAKYLNSVACGRLQKGTTKGKSTQFKKGNIPLNKGMKQEDYMSAEAIEITKTTQFKKGRLPHNTKEDGHISIRHNKPRKVKYKWIRISKGNWKELHRHIWEQTYGDIPRGCNIIFKDGNTLNCDIDNLVMVTNNELMYKNTIQRYPAEMQKAFRLIGKLTRKINNHGTK